MDLLGAKRDIEDELRYVDPKYVRIGKLTKEQGQAASDKLLGDIFKFFGHG